LGIVSDYLKVVSLDDEMDSQSVVLKVDSMEEIMVELLDLRKVEH
jgi:hypothetical protein